ncbi:hypothetical protein [Nocardia cyriacigeorgica]|uniref:hypothetical protein n=1 Tax=Nocardia cyriacigeorgica TaxID=135487 RepID=UPI002456226C|nr:hypothetical protein [Nocardia cyriacigeorgica]
MNGATVTVRPCAYAVISGSCSSALRTSTVSTPTKAVDSTSTPAVNSATMVRALSVLTGWDLLV